MHIFCKGIGIGLLELLQLCRPSQRADHIHIDPILSPFGGCHTAQATDTLFSRRISALAVIAEQSCTGCKVNDTSPDLAK